VDDAHACHLAWIAGVDAMRDMTRRSTGGVVHDEEGVALVAAGHPMPFLVNCVVRVEGPLRGPEVVERGRAFFGARGRGFTALCLAGRDDDVVEAAEAAGMSAFGEGAPVMVTERPPETIEVPDGMRLERATTPAHVADAAEVCADAYAVYGMPGDVAPAVFSPPSVLLADHVATVVAYDDEGPVATAQALVTHRTAYVQWVATSQRAFRRGAGRVVTDAATAAGFDLGADLAALLASSMGAPLYRKLGWRDVGVSVSRIAFEPLPAPAG
jgi:hypothetical protein